MKNKLIVIGWMGSQTAFLNMTREEAIARYEEVEGDKLDPDFLADPDLIREVEFDDFFHTYYV